MTNTHTHTVSIASAAAPVRYVVPHVLLINLSLATIDTYKRRQNQDRKRGEIYIYINSSTKCKKER